MAKLSLLLGPVGAGKTTFGLNLAKKEPAVFFNLDEWMTNLFRPDRPDSNLMDWYADRTKRCKMQILSMAERSLAVGIDVILEIGLIRKSEREELYSWIDDRQINLKMYVFDVEHSIRRERVIKRNKDEGPSFSMFVPPEIFELASKLWEPIGNDETEGRVYTVL